MTLFAVKLILFYNKTYFLTSHLFDLFGNVSSNRVGDRFHIFSIEVWVKLFCLGFIRCEFDFLMISNTHRVLVVNNVCGLIFIIFLFSSPLSTTLHTCCLILHTSLTSNLFYIQLYKIQLLFWRTYVKR